MIQYMYSICTHTVLRPHLLILTYMCIYVCNFSGAACVIFATHTSYIAAVSSRFMQLVFGAIEKKVSIWNRYNIRYFSVYFTPHFPCLPQVELKPYILDDQLCDECKGTQSNGQPAPFFCGSVTCLKYYCEHCWGTFHSFAGRNSHRPLFKDVFDREKFC